MKKMDDRYVQARLLRPTVDRLRQVGRRLRRRNLLANSTLGEPSLSDVIDLLLTRDADHISRSIRASERRRKKGSVAVDGGPSMQ